MDDNFRQKYPQHAILDAWYDESKKIRNKDASQIIGAFLDAYDLVPNIQLKLAEYFGMDYQALMAEKDVMLEEIRSTLAPGKSAMLIDPQTGTVHVAHPDNPKEKKPL